MSSRHENRVSWITDQDTLAERTVRMTFGPMALTDRHVVDYDRQQLTDPKFARDSLLEGSGFELVVPL